MAGPGVVIPVPLRRREERRGAERFAAAMPVVVDGQDAITQDLSSSGLAFTAQRHYAVGERVELVIEYILDGHHYPVRCAAEVVRVQQEGSTYTVGARLLPQDKLEDISVGSGAPRASLRSVR